MLYNSDRQNPSQRKRNQLTGSQIDNSIDSNSDSSLNCEINTKYLFTDSQQNLKSRSSLQEKVIPESSSSLLIQNRIRQSLQPSSLRYDDQQNDMIQPPRLNIYHNQSTNLQSQRDEQYFPGILCSRHSFQQSQLERRDMHTNSPIIHRLQSDQSNINSTLPNSNLPIVRLESQNKQQSNYFANNYYFPISSPQKQENNSPTSYFLSPKKEIGRDNLRESNNRFYVNVPTNQQKNQITSNTRKLQVKKVLENVVGQDQSSITQINQNSDNKRFSVTRIKSLSNLSNTFKRIEELETNTTITSLKNDTSISLQRNEYNKIIQFAKRHSQQTPNLAVSPLELLKKQPQKGVLKNPSKQKLNSHNILDSLEDDNTQHPLKENQNTNTKSFLNHRNLKQSPTSLEQIPEFELDNYTNQNQESGQPEITQSRVRKIIRNGLVVKKVKNDLYSPDQLDEYSQLVSSSPKKIQITGLKQKEQQLTPINQKEEVIFDDYHSNNNSPKKKQSKIQFIQSVI